MTFKYHLRIRLIWAQLMKLAAVKPGGVLVTEPSVLLKHDTHCLPALQSPYPKQILVTVPGPYHVSPAICPGPILHFMIMRSFDLCITYMHW